MVNALPYLEAKLFGRRLMIDCGKLSIPQC
jgi:hypothetical protein